MTLDELVDGIAHALKLRRAPILPMSLSQSSAPLPRFRAVSDSASTAALRRDLTPRTPRVSFMQVATYIWLFLSLSVAVLGYAACMYVKRLVGLPMSVSWC